MKRVSLRPSGGRNQGNWLAAIPVAAFALTLAVASVSCSRNDAAPVRTSETTEPAFIDVTRAAGIVHEHHKPLLDAKLTNIMAWVSSVGAAAAAGDYDRDGWIDLYVTDSAKGMPNHLYHNNGDGTFTDVAASAGLAAANGDAGVSTDCIWGDYDNDGWIDLYLVRWGTNSLFKNRGDGTFIETTNTCFRRRDGTAGTDWANGNGAVFLDFNHDGRLDIYVGNYFRDVDLWHLETTRIMHADFETSRDGGINFFYRQEADGTFSEVAAPLGVDDSGWTLAVGSADVNNDGWTDLYCANDFGPDQLFLNRQDGTFENVSDTALGVDTKKGMNVEFGDFNNDGWLDIYVTNITTAEYLREGNMLWHNNGTGLDGKLTFTDISVETGTFDGGWGWGAKFFDADSDGNLDLIGVNGFISAGEGDYWYDLASWTVLGKDPADAANWPTLGDRSFSGFEPTRFWHNTGIFSFEEKAARVGFAGKEDGRGVVCFDYDNDGDVDVYVANQGQAPNLFRNDTPKKNHWLFVELESAPEAEFNRDAIGTRVTILTQKGLQVRERDGGNGYCGQSDPRLHFGLGQEDRIALLEVRWPDGGLQRMENIPADQRVTVRHDPQTSSRDIASDIPIKAARPLARTNEDDDAGEETRPPLERSIDPAEANLYLTGLEKELRASPSPYAAASAYRSFCAANEMHDRAVGFFEQLSTERPSDQRIRIELALAYVDKIPTRGGPAAIVSKGTLARKSLDQLDHVIAADGNSWVAYYTRGMNHLYWPRALRHSDDAVADLMRCLELQQNVASDSAREDVLARVHVALGDAYVKAKRTEEARKAWNEGAANFPSSAELKERLALTDAAILAYVESQRSLERPIDTDLSFLDHLALP